MELKFNILCLLMHWTQSIKFQLHLQIRTYFYTTSELAMADSAGGVKSNFEAVDDTAKNQRTLSLL